jgi:putative transposase
VNGDAEIVGRSGEQPADTALRAEPKCLSPDEAGGEGLGGEPSGAAVAGGNLCSLVEQGPGVANRKSQPPGRMATMANSTVLEVKKKREPFVPPDGWVVQAFQFALDLTDDQRRICARQWGGRRYAYNWTLRTIKTGVDNYNATGVESEPPSFYRLRKQWNAAKDTLCVDSETGEMWWPEVGKEAFADGVRGAVEGYWNWQRSKSGNRKGRKMGFPRFKKKGRDQDRFTITTGVMRLEPDRRHLSISKLGCVRTHENTRKIERLVTSGRARILAVTVRRSGSRAIASLRVIVARPQQPSSGATSVVGVDVGVRTLATVANAEGRVLERVANPTPLANELSALRPPPS